MLGLLGAVWCTTRATSRDCVRTARTLYGEIAEAVTILDTWYTTGLRGSGSHDFTMSDYFVPEERTYSYQELKYYRSGSLYRFPLNILFKFAAVPLGVARAALDAITHPRTREETNRLRPELRRKLEDDPRHPQLITTVHGMGYRLEG